LRLNPPQSGFTTSAKCYAYGGMHCHSSPQLTLP
jgi:hypothetical protein